MTALFEKSYKNTRTKKEGTKGTLSFYARGGTRKSDPTVGRVRKCPVDTFLARGRVLQIQDASGSDVD